MKLPLYHRALVSFVRSKQFRTTKLVNGSTKCSSANDKSSLANTLAGVSLHEQTPWSTVGLFNFTAAVRATDSVLIVGNFSM
ncbi:hypothetical protein GWI33_009906 [Rhynchophorus ferrugineus]|uniref:Uncharacterized protein n=1 Tax=Rhynchophorus ferrugineus TaxID=354439 RepID=A0A834M9F8_RHYFE|nr:hypothetical protein GWI33_017009 [Rhynchophorus ferrugineus]KAF7276701.1 hypothetical protein GWI33_009906 [Rhynchophorus ferrugineus]